MSTSQRATRLCPAILSLLLLCLLAACTGAAPAAGPYVWIDVPTDGLQVEVGQEVRIEGHASHQGSIVRVEIWANDEPHLVQENPPAEGNLAHFDQLWMPPGAGEYIVQVFAVGEDGSRSAPDSVRLYVGTGVAAATPTLSPVPEETVEPPTDTPTPVQTEGPTATPTIPPPPQPTATPTPPGPIIDFWADAEQVNAGSCTEIHWHVENVQAVFFNGGGVPGQGSHETCPCSDETHTLAVDLNDGSQEQRFVTIHVSGSCVTPAPTSIPTPPPDITPPSAPSPLKPLNGVELGCVPKVMLRWDSVSDPSGIGEYRVQVERHAGDENWQSVSASPWTGLTATELEIDVECGWIYRWRVRAVDGAANGGPFSGWFEFTVTLI